MKIDVLFLIKEEKVFIKYMEILEKVRNIIKNKSSVKWNVLGHPRPKLNKIISSIKPSGPF